MNTFVITYQPLDQNKMISIQFYWLRNIDQTECPVVCNLFILFQKFKLFHYWDYDLEYSLYCIGGRTLSVSIGTLELEMSLFWIAWEKVKFWLGTGSLLNIFRSEVEFLISKSPPLDLFRKNLSNQTCITLMPPPIYFGFTSIILTVETTLGKW